MRAPAGNLGKGGQIVVEIGPLAAHTKLGRFVRESLGFRLVELAPPRLSKRRQNEEPPRAAYLHDSRHETRSHDVLAVDGRPPSPPERADPDRPALLLHLNER